MQDSFNRTNGSIDPPLSTTAAPTSPLDLETRRLALIGRITANIVHEMSNPMQAIRGGTTLAMEDINNSASVLEYLQLIQQGTDRTLVLIKLIHSLYAPEQSPLQSLDLEEFILNLKPIVNDDLNHKGLTLQVIRPAEPIYVQVLESFFELALLNLLLTFNRILASLKCKNYSVRLFHEGLSGCVEFSLPPKINFDPDGQNLFEIQFSQSYLQKMGGSLSLKTTNEQTLVRVVIPLTLSSRESNGE
jgi:hypothetical protein